MSFITRSASRSLLISASAPVHTLSAPRSSSSSLAHEEQSFPPSTEATIATKAASPPLTTPSNSSTAPEDYDDEEQCLVLLKPDTIVRRQVGVEIIEKLRCLPDSYLMCFAHAVVPRALATLHYARDYSKHQAYQISIDILSAKAGVMILVIEGRNVVERVKKLIGPLNVEDAREVEGTIRGTYGCVGVFNSAFVSDNPKAGKREIMLWTSALGLVIDEEKANKDADQYIQEWKGKCPSNMKEVQATCSRIRANINKLKELLQKETDSSLSVGADEVIKMVEQALL